MRATARIIAGPTRDGTRCTTLTCEPPLTFRRTSAGLTWVGTAAGPVGGDDLRLTIDLQTEATLTIGSAGASIALPGVTDDRSQMRIEVTLASHASLFWRPEPLILAAGANHIALTRIELGDGVDLVWVDELVLGRHDEQCGRLSSRLVVDGPSGPVLRTGLEIGAPGWDGPAVTNGHRAHAQVLLAGVPAACADQLELDDAVGCTVADLTGGVRLITIVATEPRHLRACVDQVWAVCGSPRLIRL
jgi:urease accessory protein